VGELGKILREARESRGLTIKQVGEATRIRPIFLEALEEERFEDMPGDVYNRGFLRTYARFLDLDGEALVEAYRRQTGTTSPSIPRVLDEPLLRHTRPSLFASLFLAAMLLLVVGLAGWYGYHRYYLGVLPWPLSQITPASATQSPPNPTASVPAVTVQPSPTESSVEATQTVAQLSTPAEKAAVSASSPTPTPTLSLAGTATSVSSPTPRPQVTRTATPTIGPTATLAGPEMQGAIRVEAKVVAETYIELTLDGREVDAVILRVGQNQVWTAENSIKLRIGNAAGLQLTVNGVPVKALGAQGQVVEVEYTPDNLPQP
jgi:cytoskeleton protein RodZ